MSRDYDPESTTTTEQTDSRRRHDYWLDFCECCKLFFVAFVIVAVMFLPSTIWSVWESWDDI